MSKSFLQDIFATRRALNVYDAEIGVLCSLLERAKAGDVDVDGLRTSAKNLKEVFPVIFPRNLNVSEQTVLLLDTLEKNVDKGDWEYVERCLAKVNMGEL